MRASAAFTAADNETLELNTKEVKELLVRDPFYKLEHMETDKRKAKKSAGAVSGECMCTGNHAHPVWL